MSRLQALARHLASHDIRAVVAMHEGDLHVLNLAIAGADDEQERDLLIVLAMCRADRIAELRRFITSTRKERQRS